MRFRLPILRMHRPPQEAFSEGETHSELAIAEFISTADPLHQTDTFDVLAIGTASMSPALLSAHQSVYI